eukprot:5036307-Prymnesium_polylepis.2
MGRQISLSRGAGFRGRSRRVVAWAPRGVGCVGFGVAAANEAKAAVCVRACVRGCMLRRYGGRTRTGTRACVC